MEVNERIYMICGRVHMSVQLCDENNKSPLIVIVLPRNQIIIQTRIPLDHQAAQPCSSTYEREKVDPPKQNVYFVFSPDSVRTNPKDTELFRDISSGAIERPTLP
jgi:hypothetical protein